MRVRSSKMRVFSVDRNIFRMKFPSGFTYRNLHGFARFPGDSTAVVFAYFPELAAGQEKRMQVSACVGGSIKRHDQTVILWL